MSPVRFHDLRHVDQVFAADGGAALPELMSRRRLPATGGRRASRLESGADRLPGDGRPQLDAVTGE